MDWSRLIKAAVERRLTAAPEVVETDAFAGLQLNTNPDGIVSTHGIEAYKEMLRDAEIYADLEIRLCGMMPGLQVIEADDSEEAEIAARLVRRVFDRMSGSMLLKLRDGILREALVSGFAVAEEVQEVYEDVEFGSVIGLRDLKVKPSENFEIQTDAFGNIIAIQQRTMRGTIAAPLDRLIYYAFKGTSDNPYGRSILHGAYNAYKLKTHVFREYAMFLDANAGGIRKATINKNDFSQQRDKVKQILNRLSADTSIVLPDSVDLDIMLPSGSAGEHFVKAIREVCNKEIRKAILYDESINAEGMATGSYASKKVSQNIVYETLAIQGGAFAEIIKEQLIKRILEWNGFDDYPTPILTAAPTMQQDADPASAITALSTAYTSGLITEPLPIRVQEDIQRRMVEGFGATWVEELVETPDEGEARAEDDTPALVMFSAPSGRTKADMLRRKKRIKANEKIAVEKWLETAGETKGKLETAIGKVLFDRSGNWRTEITTNGVPKLGAIRKALSSVSHTGGSLLRRMLTDVAFNEYELGKKDAQDMVPIEAAVLPSARLSQAQAAEIISQDVYMALSSYYTNLDKHLFYAVRNVTLAGGSPQLAALEIGGVVAKELGATAGQRITQGILTSGYMMGQKEIFSGISENIAGWKYDATYDDVTCEDCIAWHDTFIAADDPGLPSPPMHGNCRCVLIPVYAGEDPGGWVSGGEWATSSEVGKLNSLHNNAIGYGGL